MFGGEQPLAKLYQVFHVSTLFVCLADVLFVATVRQDPDDTLKRKTFELLYKMTKSSNVEVIVDRMIDYMISINDNHYKTEIASRCVELAEQFAPSNQWFIQVAIKPSLFTVYFDTLVLVDGV